MDKKVKVGIIGCGGIANGKHMPSITSTIKEAEIVAFCDIVEDRAVKAAETYGTKDAKVFTDYKQLLNMKEIDVVHVLTPNKSHCSITVDSLKAGKHVLCEKPMAISSKEAKLMLDTSKETGKLLSIGYQCRNTPEALYVKKACEKGTFGDVYFAKAHAIRRRAVPTWGVFLNKEEQGGGSLIDIGTHALDLTLWLLDNYKPVNVMGNVYQKLNNQKETGNAWGDWDPKQFTVEDSSFGFITMENGATIFLENSWALNTVEVFEAMTTLCGTKAGADMRGGLKINYIENNTQVITSPSFGGGVAFYEGVSAKPEHIEQMGFYNAVMHGKDLIVKPEQAYVVSQILEAIYESSKTQKMVSFK